MFNDLKMHLKSLFVIFIMSFILASCSRWGIGHKNAYLKQPQVVSPLVIPKGVALKQGRDFYPLLTVPNTAATHKPPSLVPPGSLILTYRHAKSVNHQRRKSA